MHVLVIVLHLILNACNNEIYSSVTGQYYLTIEGFIRWRD